VISPEPAKTSVDNLLRLHEAVSEHVVGDPMVA